MITIYDWFGYEIPNKERYSLIKEAGFDGVLLWWSNDFGRDCFGIDDYRNGPQAALEAGLVIENIHAPVMHENHLWLDNLDGEAAVECYLRCITDCADYEIPTMVMHLPHEDYSYNTLGMDRFKKITEKAELLDINVALENVKNLPNLEFVLEQVNSQRIGLCYDSAHNYHFYPNEDLLTKFGSRLMALHFHDNNGSHAQHGLPFDGTTDWAVTMKKISETGYTGPIAIEAMNWDYKYLTAEQFLHKAYERAKKLETLKINIQ